MLTRMIYPFTAIAGQDELKLALLLNAVDPHIGGVLAMGDRGTAKSTAVRALASLLPPIAVMSGCRFHCDPSRPHTWCDECQTRPTGAATRTAGEITAHAHAISVPMVELPLGASEDRLLGSLDIEAALVLGERRFEPGILARAHRGFLYVDEVNLLDDHLVDRLLDVAASGVNRVEREGISLTHPAEFVLVGSGNPEEGELRPQLLDRFGLYVCVSTITDVATRAEIVRRRLAYTANPADFVSRYQGAEEALANRIAQARANLAQVVMPDDLIDAIAGLCCDLEIVGHRGELTVVRTAKALAAFEGSHSCTWRHVAQTAPMALRHRLRRDPLDPIGDDDAIAEALVIRQSMLGGDEVEPPPYRAAR